MKKPQPQIYFFTEGIQFNLPQKKRIKQWLIATAHSEHFQIETLNYIFCSDDYLFNLNQQYLNHDTFTDIITFQHDSEKGFLGGDIYISIERVLHNSKEYQATFTRELYRVMIHGLLHLCGYKDKTNAAKKLMRSKEDYYLAH